MKNPRATTILKTLKGNFNFNLNLSMHPAE